MMRMLMMAAIDDAVIGGGVWNRNQTHTHTQQLMATEIEIDKSQIGEKE